MMSSTSSDESVAAVQVHCPTASLAPTLVFRGSATTIGRCLPFHQAIIDTLPEGGSDVVVSRSHVVVRATELGALVERVGRNPSFFRSPNNPGQADWTAIPLSMPMLLARRGNSAIELALIYDELAKEYRHIFHIRILTLDDVHAHEHVHSADESTLAGASSVSKVGKPNQLDVEVWEFSSQALVGSQVGDVTVTMQRAIINKPRVNPFQQSAGGTPPVLFPDSRAGPSATAGGAIANNTDDDSTTDDSDHELAVPQQIASQTSQQPNLVRMQTLHAPIRPPRPTAITLFRSGTSTGASDLGADGAESSDSEGSDQQDEGEQDWDKVSEASTESDLFPEPVEMYEIYSKGMVPLFALVPPPDPIDEEEKRRQRKSKLSEDVKGGTSADAKRMKA